MNKQRAISRPISRCSIICYWRYEKTETRLWHFVESYVIDEDGYPLEPNKERYHHRTHWLHEKVMVDGECIDLKPIMGRAVTIWTIMSGVRLLGLHPAEWSDWLSPTFFENLISKSDWYAVLEGGHILWSGTSKEVSHYLTLHERTA